MTFDSSIWGKRKVRKIILLAGKWDPKRLSISLKLQSLLREELVRLYSPSTAPFCILSSNFLMGWRESVPPNGSQREYRFFQVLYCSHLMFTVSLSRHLFKGFSSSLKGIGHKANKISILYYWPGADRCMPLIVLKLTIKNGNRLAQ